MQTQLCTWVEEDDGSKAAQLSFIHLHVSHFAYKLCQNPAERRGEGKKRFADGNPSWRQKEYKMTIEDQEARKMT